MTRARYTLPPFRWASKRWSALRHKRALRRELRELRALRDRALPDGYMGLVVAARWMLLSFLSSIFAALLPPVIERVMRRQESLVALAPSMALGLGILLFAASLWYLYRGIQKARGWGVSFQRRALSSQHMALRARISRVEADLELLELTESTPKPRARSGSQAARL